MKTIAGFYQCYKEKKAFTHAVEAYRKNYPTENLYIINDNGDESLKEIANKYNAIYHYKYTNTGYTNWHDRKNEGIRILEKPLEWLSRLYDALLTFTEEFFIILEEDVYVINKVNIDDLQYDINGCNNCGFSDIINKYIYSVNLNLKDKLIKGSGAFGGTILRTSFFKKILENKDNIKKHLINYYNLEGIISQDQIVTFLTYVHNGTVGNISGYVQFTDDDYIEKYNSNKIDVLHQYYKLYENKSSYQKFCEDQSILLNKQYPD